MGRTEGNAIPWHGEKQKEGSGQFLTLNLSVDVSDCVRQRVKESVELEVELRLSLSMRRTDK